VWRLVATTNGVAIFRLRRPRFTEGDIVPWSGLAFVGASGGVATTLAVLTASRLHADANLWLGFLVLAGLAALTDLFAVIGARNSIYDTAAVFLVAAAVLLPTGFAVIAAVPADWRRRRASTVSLVHNCATAGLATLAASAVVHHAPSTSDAFSAALYAAAVVAYAATSSGLDGLFSHFGRGERLPAVSIYEAGAELVLASLGIALAAFWMRDPWLTPFVLTPLAFIHRSQRLPALEEEAVTDPKTGLLNMRRFEELLSVAVDRAIGAGRPISLIVADLDLLREINNTHGHLAGDAVIADVSTLLRQHVRRDDLAARFGGEEFLLAMPGTTPDVAVAVAERMREAVASRVFSGESPRFAARATVSIGVASFPRDAATPRDLVHAADVAVLAAKARGRNRVVDAASLSEPAAANVADAATLLYPL
jgi:diguanylate cyclase (GGDEF)-like protein